MDLNNNNLPGDSKTLFLQMKNKLPKDKQGKIMPKLSVIYAHLFQFQPMGIKTYAGLVQSAVKKIGIDRSGKNTSNQSLRPTTFNAQDMLGMSAAQKRLVSGHVSDRTAEIYQR